MAIHMKQTDTGKLQFVQGDGTLVSEMGAGTTADANTYVTVSDSNELKAFVTATDGGTSVTVTTTIPA